MRNAPNVRLLSYCSLTIVLSLGDGSPSDFFRDPRYLPVPLNQPQPYPYYFQRPHNPFHTYRAFQTAIKLLHLDEGDYCRRGHGLYPDYVCKAADDCREPMEESDRTENYLDICTFDATRLIVCCPTVFQNKTHSVDLPEPPLTKTNSVGLPGPSPTKTNSVGLSEPPLTKTQRLGVGRPAPTTGPKPKTPVADDLRISAVATDKVKRRNIADEKCSQYRKLRFPKEKYFFIAVVGGKEALSQEFPHMVALGYGNTTEQEEDWKCGGSLISERWILTAAHCEKDQEGNKARWARLGELELGSTIDTARPKDYMIVEHVTHPDYKTSERYNDIALFRLENDVKFSSFVKPICLNTDQSLEPKLQIATGWGRTATAESTSNRLLKVGLDVFPASKCNHFSSNPQELRLGVLADSMICAGSFNDEEDTCSGDSGGPLQVKNEDDSYTQFGITSFGPAFCGVKETPGVYTRVSNYVPWIEQVVWPNT